jgi:hypothetical protein
MGPQQAQAGMTFSSKPRWFAWFCLFVSLMLLAAAVGYGFYDVSYEFSAHGTARGVTSAFYYGVSAVILLVVCLGIFISLLSHISTQVTLTEDQIKIRHGKENFSLRLDEITQLETKNQVTLYVILPVRKQQIQISTQSRKVVLYSSLGKFQRLVDELGERVYPRIYRRAEQAVQTGESVNFGGIAITRDGLTFEKRLYLWSGLTRAWLEKDALQIQPGGGKEAAFRLPVKGITNLPVLLRILSEHQLVTNK